MKSLFSILVLLVGVAAQADLKDNFKKMEGITKGPFALNYLQGTQGRSNLREPIVAPPGKFLFQAAYRNDVARAMVEQDSFYTGNLFTTNYYEIMGRYVYNDPAGSFALDHKALAAKAGQASEQVAAVTRDWVLERSYVQLLPHSKLASAFRIRGISGAEFEVEYATYYFNLGLAAVSEDFQYLPLFQLAKASPLTDAAALDRARNMISQVYDAALAQYGSSPLAKDLYAIRNAIHNQVSADVVDRISGFIKKYPKLGGNLRDNLVKIQEILKAYYNVGPSQIVKIAKATGANEVLLAATEMASKGFTPAGALRLSEALVHIRTQLADKTIAYEKQTENLVLLATAAQYLNKELGSMKSPTGKEPLLATLNLLYVEGYLIRDNWDYFRSEINGAADLVTAVAMISDLIEIGTDTLTQAFEPSLSRWILVEPKMQYFIDNTIKASSLNTAAYLAKEVK